MRILIIWISIMLAGLTATPSIAADYVIDTKGAHAFIQFRVKHLGYSWLYGRFNQFEGTFSFDENNPEDASINVLIDTTSVDSNHAERDNHLRGKKFLNVKAHPEAKFVSTQIESSGEGKAIVRGNLTLNGVTREVAIDAYLVGMGDDPWGGYRAGFQGETQFAMKDFGIEKDFGTVEMILSIEGIRQ